MKNVSEWNLGEILSYCQDYKIFTDKSDNYQGCHFPYHPLCVSLGNFAAQCHSHDTGYSVRAYIIGSEEPYPFLNGTYWKRPGYDHNSFVHEHGVWDKYFNEFCLKLTEAVRMHLISIEENRNKLLLSEKEKKDKRKAEAEALFTQKEARQ